jgi:hypothetical protein
MTTDEIEMQLDQLTAANNILREQLAATKMHRKDSFICALLSNSAIASRIDFEMGSHKLACMVHRIAEAIIRAEGDPANQVPKPKGKQQ